MYKHKHKLVSGFTARYNLTRLACYESTSDVDAAITPEKQIKGWLRRKKIALVETVSPEWKAPNGCRTPVRPFAALKGDAGGAQGDTGGQASSQRRVGWRARMTRPPPKSSSSARGPGVIGQAYCHSRAKRRISAWLGRISG